MKLYEQLKKNIETLKEGWAVNNPDHPRIAKRNAVIKFFIQSQLSLIDSMVERMRGDKTEKGNLYCTCSGWGRCQTACKRSHNQALQDQIDYLLEQKKLIKELL